MKQIAILLICVFFNNLRAQEPFQKELKSEVNEVVVFIEGAQVTRKKSVDLVPGTTILKFTGLSPFIDSKSIQVKAKGEVMVLAVNHQQNFLDKPEKSLQLVDLEKQLREIEDKIALENTYLSILSEELAFLNANRVIGGKNQELSVTNLKESSTFYSTKLTSLKLGEIERNKTVEELTKQHKDIENQIKTLTSQKEYPAGEIWVKIDASKAVRADLEISYLVGNASWFPTYDIRAKNISEPVELFYKANVRQDTKEDWKNVKLKFSSSNPNKTGLAPELKTYLLDYNTLPPVYNQSFNTVKGIVMDQDQVPLPFVNILVQGTTIGTFTDLNGYYSITIPDNAGFLNYSFIGYISKTLPVTSSVMNVILQEDVVGLEEVTVTAQGISKNRDYSASLQGKVAGVSVQNERDIKSRGAGSLAMPTVQIERQTTVEFEIKMPYTVMSDNKNYTVDIEAYNLPAMYQYYCVPKIDRDAFLIARITDWEKYNLLEGEANMFFEDTYVGKTLLDVRYASDTLDISLGRDKNVSVNREKIKDYTTKQLLGNKKEETRAWKITVKNNKSQEINMVILDQVPVSALEEIEIEIRNISGAELDSESGKVKWEFSLPSNDKKEFELWYAVKYPKYRNLIIE